METHVASDWRIVGASAIGTAHLRAGRTCDDAHASMVRRDGTVLLAVADGAGSVPRAAEGALEAVGASLRCANLALDKHGAPTSDEMWLRLLRSSLRCTRLALERAAIRQAIATGAATLPRVGELATTLSLAVITREWIAVVQVGDGAVVVREENESLRSILAPVRGEYANETDFLTGDDYLDRANYAIEPQSGLTGISLMTDGLTMLALDGASSEPFVPFFQPMFAYARQPEANDADLRAFLQSERVCERTDDDKTLLIAVRH